MVKESCDAVVDGRKEQFFKACKWSPMLNGVCGCKKTLQGWPLRRTPLLKQLLDLRKASVAMYRTAVRRNKGIPTTVQIDAPRVGPVEAATLTVLSDGGKILWVSLCLSNVQYLETALRWQVENKIVDESAKLPKLPTGITRATRYGRVQYRVFVNRQGEHKVLFKYFNTLDDAEDCLESLES